MCLPNLSRILLRSQKHPTSVEQLAKPANEWMVWKNKLTHEECCRALRTLMERKQLLAAYLRNSLTTETLIFRQDTIDTPPTSAKCKLESLLLCNPIRIWLKYSGKSQIASQGSNYLNVTGTKLSRLLLQHILRR